MHGDLYHDEDWLCYTLEDEKRDIKIAGKTAIPAGKYNIKIRNLGESRLDARYSELFEFYTGQLWLQDVENFTYIYIHCGNNDTHTDGCLLVGLKRHPQAIGQSRKAYKKIYPKIMKAIQKKEDVYITISDSE